MYYHLIPPDTHEAIKKLYSEGYSCQEILDTLKLKTTVRSIQRLLAKHNLTRSVGDSFRNAISRGRVRFVRKHKDLLTHRTKLKPSLRYKILERDGFKCIKCGSTAQTALLEVDHIDSNPANHTESNLQTLCWQCNIGKPSPNRKNVTTLSGSF